MQKLRLAINGFGRIGRMVVRAFLKYPQLFDRIEIVAINDVANAPTLLHLLNFDSTHGRLSVINAKATLHIDDATHLRLSKDEQLIADVLLFKKDNPDLLPWRALNIDVVLECTGHFRSYEQASKHKRAGAKQVIIGAAPFDKVDASIVMGVNDHLLYHRPTIISGVSCTTQALVPLLYLLDTTLGVDDDGVRTRGGHDLAQLLGLARTEVGVCVGLCTALDHAIQHLGTGGFGKRRQLAQRILGFFRGALVPDAGQDHALEAQLAVLYLGDIIEFGGQACGPAQRTACGQFLLIPVEGGVFAGGLVQRLGASAEDFLVLRGTEVAGLAGGCGVAGKNAFDGGLELRLVQVIVLRAGRLWIGHVPLCLLYSRIVPRTLRCALGRGWVVLFPVFAWCLHGLAPCRAVITRRPEDVGAW